MTTRTLVVAAAGVSDRPQEELGGRTPLEAARTPAFDRMAVDGRLGYLVPVPEGSKPEDGAFALSLFGLDPRRFPDIGATLDAAAFDVAIGSLDQAFRLSLVTAHEDTLFDPTAGHISRDEAALLLETLTLAVADPDLVFVPGDGWRNLLLWRGARDVRVQTTSPYDLVGQPLSAALPRGTGVARLSAAVAKSADVLSHHEVNECRSDLKENPATLAWAWGGGVATPLPAFRERTGISCAAIGVNPCFVGAARLQGVRTIPVAGATGTTTTDFRAKADAALRALDDHDLVFLHVDAAAEASHSRDFVAKVEAIQRIDASIVAPALREAERREGLRVVVVAAEGVAVDSGRHLVEPAPFAIFGAGARGRRGTEFSERAARESGFLVEKSHELLDFVLHLS